MSLAGCTDTGAGGADAPDPYAPANRQVHAFNKAVDRALVRPAAMAYGTAVPKPVRGGIDNVTANLALPGYFINHLLQGDAASAGETFFRFGLNSTFGLAGLRDPAADAGLFTRKTDFGETLAVWGVRQGAYVELPLLGPSTERAFAGRVVDTAINPVSYVLRSGDLPTYYALNATSLIGARYDYRSIVDALLYESADSYAAQRIAYLQNKAANLGGGTAAEDLEDPYAFDQ